MIEFLFLIAFWLSVAGCAGIIAYASWDLRRCLRRREAIRKRLQFDIR
jgi:hypothetical protein